MESVLTYKRGLGPGLPVAAGTVSSALRESTFLDQVCVLQDLPQATVGCR